MFEEWAKYSKKYRIIELRHYDILLPFICYKCGSCCRNYVPQIYSNKIHAISEYLGLPEAELIKIHEIAYFSKPEVDCPFLTSESQCAIYPHRPPNCQLYPLDTDLHNADVDCPGYKEFRNIWERFAKGRRYFPLRDPNSNPKKELRAVPNREWPKFLRTLNNCNPSSQMFKEFININTIKNENICKNEPIHED